MAVVVVAVDGQKTGAPSHSQRLSASTIQFTIAFISGSEIPPFNNLIPRRIGKGIS